MKPVGALPHRVCPHSAVKEGLCIWGFSVCITSASGSFKVAKSRHGLVERAYFVLGLLDASSIRKPRVQYQS